MTNAERARRYGRLLRSVIRRRRVLSSEVARAVGAESSSVSDWINGHKLPTLEYCMALAEVLGYDRLLAYALFLRTKTCDACGVEYVDRGRNIKARYCSRRCSVLASKRRRRGSVESRYKTDRAALTRHRDAVACYCADCEPAGVCRTPECPLRDVSPLPCELRERPTEAPSTASDKMLAYIERRYDAA